MRAAYDLTARYIADLTNSLEGEHSKWLTPREREFFLNERARAQYSLIEIERWLR